jgi:hypothetical protein
MEEKLCRFQPSTETIFNEPSRFRRLALSMEMWKGPLDKSICYTLSSNCLLANTAYHLTQVDRITFRAAQ